MMSHRAHGPTTIQSMGSAVGFNPRFGSRIPIPPSPPQRYVNAIDVCQKVLAQHAAYPRIRKDILDKARALLRP